MPTTSPIPEQPRVLVTRPAHQAEPLCRALEAAGFAVLRFPVIAIVPLAPDRERLQHLGQQRLLLFTSVNAVDGFLRLVRESGVAAPFGVDVAAIGGRTAEALHEAGFRRVLTAPLPYTSEALLTLPQLRDLRDEPAMLVTGEGGRGLIAAALRERGVRLSVLPVYRRALPDTDPAPLQRALQRGDLHLLTITSGEAMDNLRHLSGPAWSDLRSLPLVTVSKRLGEKARADGFTAEIRITSASDAALVRSVVGWRQQTTTNGHAHER